MQIKDSIENKKSLNILLTYYCNNKCKYCFNPISQYASDEKNIFMSVENFRYVLDFLKINKIKEVRLLGGEPLIHPDLRTIFELIIKEKYFNSVTIFTNGIFSHKTRDYLIKLKKRIYVYLVLNLNHPTEYSKKKYNLILDNLEFLKDNLFEISISYNIYQRNFDYEYLFETCRNYGIRTIRVCIANPDSENKNEILSRVERKKIGKRLFSFCIKAYENQIKILFDCTVPLCILSDDQLGKLVKIGGFSSYIFGVCSPAIDVDPFLNVFRCFPTNKIISRSLKGVNSIKKLNLFFYKEIDFYKWQIIDEKCKKCDYFRLRTCQGDCIGFKSKRIIDLKKKRTIANNCFRLARRDLKRKLYNDAILKFESGLKTYKYDITAICDYIFILIKTNQFTKAISKYKYFEDILDSDYNGLSLYIKGLVYELQKRHNDAIISYRRALGFINSSINNECLKRIKYLKSNKQRIG
jgi:radical SAM protein with 4Fe4S-binding SPASM domain